MRSYDLYIVPTPIGNLGDITLRAIEVLKSVDVIACEDSRVTQKLLNHYDIKTKCISYHKYNEKERIQYFLGILSEGKKIALVSDAGTPLFCDPGAILVKKLKENGYSITSLAGANAVATFLSSVARDGEDFLFTGFLPKSEVQIGKILEKFCATDIVFYESPNRLLKTLDIIKSTRKCAKVAIGRELTKVFEEIFVGFAEDAVTHFKNNTLKGEIVAMVFRENSTEANIDLLEKIKVLQDKKFSSKDISTILSSLYGINKNEIYKLAR